eukprot:m51a1_g10939 putative ubiquitin carboxyl-terminal hydrolase family protein (442) ;mRNA; r:172562-174676
MAEAEARRAVERESVQSLVRAFTVRIDQVCVLVCAQWWNHWCAYTGYPSGAPQDVPRPGPIDNTSIIAENGVLTPGLAEGRDVFGVPVSVWRYLQAVYGGGPPVVRLFVPHGALNSPRLELYPLVLFARMTGLRVTNSGETLMLFLLSPDETLKDMRRYLGLRSGMAPHKLSIATGEYGGSNKRKFADTDMDRTLAELGISNNTFFFMNDSVLLVVHNGEQWTLGHDWSTDMKTFWRDPNGTVFSKWEDVIAVMPNDTLDDEVELGSQRLAELCGPKAPPPTTPHHVGQFKVMVPLSFPKYGALCSRCYQRNWRCHRGSRTFGPTPKDADLKAAHCRTCQQYRSVYGAKSEKPPEGQMWYDDEMTDSDYSGDGRSPAPIPVPKPTPSEPSPRRSDRTAAAGEVGWLEILGVASACFQAGVIDNSKLASVVAREFRDRMCHY